MLGSAGSTAARGDVPDVTGKSISSAFGILQRAGFAPRVGSSENSNVPAGFVSSTDPGAGSSANDGDTVVIHPSNGRGGGAGQGIKPGRGRKKRPPPRA